MDKTTYKQVRNLIFNDAGVTREEIRKVVEDIIDQNILSIVKAEVARYLKSVFEERVHGMISAEIRRWTNKNIQETIKYNGYQNLENAIKNHIKEIIAEKILLDIDLSFDVKKKGVEIDE